MNSPASPEFLDSLLEGDLVAASVQSSTRLHLVRIVKRVTAEMLRGDPGEAVVRRLFDARVLCKANPRYFWRPVDDLEAWAPEDRCPWCFQRWRSLKRPAIKGWKAPEAVVVSSLRLPWGWAEVTPTGHPLDLPADAPDPDPEEEEEKVGAKRVEVKRWVRGSRYVRLTQSLADKRFASRYGALVAEPAEERWWFKSGYDAALNSAITLMALGGSPSDRTDPKEKP